MEVALHQIFQVLQATFNCNNVHTKSYILPKKEGVSLSFCHPYGHIKRPHITTASKIPINLKSLFKYENFISVCNMVATCSWIPIPNLSYLAHYLPNVEFISNNTSAITIRVDKMTCRMFTTGVVVFTSGITIEQTKYEAHQYRLLMSQIPVPVLLFDRNNPNHKPHFEIRTLEPLSEFVDFKVVNMVASGIANKQPLDLMRIVSETDPIGEASWSPEHFPGARIRLYRNETLPFHSDSVSVHLFDTGKNMVMGTNLDDMRMAQQFICNWVKPYIDPNLPINPLNRHNYRIMRMLTYTQNKNQYIDALAPSNMSIPTNDNALKRKRNMETNEQTKNAVVSFLNDTSNIPESINPFMVPTMPASFIDDNLDDEQEEEIEQFIESHLENILLNNLRTGNIIRRK